MISIDINKIQKLETEMLFEIKNICQKHNIDYFLAYGSALGAVRHHGPIPWDTDCDITMPVDSIDSFCTFAREELSPKFKVYSNDVNNDYDLLFPRIGVIDTSSGILHVDIFPLIGISPNQKIQSRFYNISKNLDLLYFHKKKKIKEMSNCWYKRIAELLIKLFLFPFSEDYFVKRFRNLCMEYPLKNSEYVMSVSNCYKTKNVVPASYFSKPIVMRYNDFFISIPEDYDNYLKHFYGDYLKYPPKEEQDSQRNRKVFIDEKYINNE